MEAGVSCLAKHLFELSVIEYFDLVLHLWRPRNRLLEGADIAVIIESKLLHSISSNSNHRTKLINSLSMGFS